MPEESLQEMWASEIVDAFLKEATERGCFKGFLGNHHCQFPTRECHENARRRKSKNETDEKMWTEKVTKKKSNMVSKFTNFSKK